MTFALQPASISFQHFSRFSLVHIELKPSDKFGFLCIHISGKSSVTN
ncbi:unnamed protein product [Acanthoscelides obtectus]|uniref:Uncharacterized protein n=1 Tax=Acanthoscelides obtectus TaxID=200917 RepID=A0A9P0PQP0_ACAOB|nr:unnamed protein product [Acanthoscelides obtectus]CAK1682234.1 hypothetical protein AOBTE_LOCUS33503 [Acanthoscelides obtectus]